MRREERLNQFIFANKITWQFNLSWAPWWGGGQFERLIGVVKAALHKIIGHGMLSWGKLEELLLDVETTLNNHPLGIWKMTSSCLRQLQTPYYSSNQMLWSYPREAPLTLGREDCDVVCATLTNARMKCGSCGTTNTKSPRGRGTALYDTAPLELKENNAVIVRSEERNRGRWSLGIVTELIRGKHGIVRGMKLQSGTGYIERAVQHLHPLELSCDRTTVESDLSKSEEVPNITKRSAAVAARERITEIAHAEQELK